MIIRVCEKAMQRNPEDPLTFQEMVDAIGEWQTGRPSVSKAVCAV